MSTGIGSFLGYPPKVKVVERMLMSSVPEQEREAFTKALGPVVQRTRSGEIVFDASEYRAWKQR